MVMNKQDKNGEKESLVLVKMIPLSNIIIA